MAHIFTARQMTTLTAIVAMMAALTLLTPAAASAGTFHWRTDGNGFWNDPANWQHLSGPVGSGYPNGRDDVAVFSFTISAERVVRIPSGVVITIGTLQIAESFNLTIEGVGATSPGLLIFSSSAASATLDVIGNHIINHEIRAPIELESNLTVDVFSSDSSISFQRNISQSGVTPRSVKKAGHGMMRLSSEISNDYAGPTVVEEGTIDISQTSGVIAIPGDVDIGLASGDSPAYLRMINGQNTIAATSRMRVLATGTFDLRDHSQSLASLTIAGGFVSVGRTSFTGGFLTAASLSMTGGTLNVGTSTARYRLTGAATITSSATQSAMIQGTGALQLNGTGTFTVPDGPADSDLMMSLAVVDDSFNFGLTKSGAGTMRFFGTPINTYTGPTTVQEGRLELARTPGATAIRGALLVGGAGSLAEVAILESNTIENTSAISVLPQGVLTVTNASDRVGSLNLTEASAVFTDAVLEVTGLTMTGATLRLATAGSSLSLTAGVRATSVPGRPSVIGGSGSLSLNGAQRTFIVPDGPEDVDLRVDANIAGVAIEGITKTQTGVALFAGRNTYDGPTAVNAGTLIVTGTLTSAVTVVVDATLRGNGRVDAITAQSGATVSPGLSPGLLTSAPLSLHAGSRFVMELIGSAAGTGYDQVRVAGGVELNGAQLLLVVGPALSQFGQFILIDNDGADPVAGTFDGLPEGATITAGAEDGREFTVSYRGGDGNDVVLTPTGEVSYFLAEGATGAFFDEDVLIANPNPIDAPVTVTFLREGGSALVRTYTITKESRLTIRVDEIQELAEAAVSVKVVSDARLPLAVERTMFWDATHYGGHTSNAVARAERQWIFAEGSQGFFDTYVLLANANAEPTTATITFLLEDAAPVVKDVPLPAFARKTIWAGDYSEVRDRSFGIIVDAADPIIAERAMYFGGAPGKLWPGGLVNTGTTTPSPNWFHAEGATGAFFYTFILMSNPQTTPANVTLRFLLENGGEVTLAKTIAPQTRLTVNPAAEGDPRLAATSLSTVVTSDVPIVSERSMYWGGDASPFGEGHNSSGMVTTATRWGLGDGRVGGPESFVTYILLANPAHESADVAVTFLREGGAAPIVKTYTVPGASRFNIDVGSSVPELRGESFGARVEVTNGVAIAIERSMYWNANGIFWAGGTNALGTPLP